MKDFLIKNPSQFIQETRQMLKLSQKEMAKKLKVSKTTISYWESGHRTPSLKHLQLCLSLKKKHLSEDEDFEEQQLQLQKESPPSEKLEYSCTKRKKDSTGEIVQLVGLAALLLGAGMALGFLLAKTR